MNRSKWMMNVKVVIPRYHMDDIVTDCYVEVRWNNPNIAKKTECHLPASAFSFQLLNSYRTPDIVSSTPRQGLVAEHRMGYVWKCLADHVTPIDEAKTFYGFIKEAYFMEENFPLPI